MSTFIKCAACFRIAACARWGCLTHVVGLSACTSAASHITVALLPVCREPASRRRRQTWRHQLRAGAMRAAAESVPPTARDRPGVDRRAPPTANWRRKYDEWRHFRIWSRGVRECATFWSMCLILARVALYSRLFFTLGRNTSTWVKNRKRRKELKT